MYLFRLKVTVFCSLKMWRIINENVKIHLYIIKLGTMETML